MSFSNQVENERIYLTEEETVALVQETTRNGEALSMDFGPGWTALIVDQSKPMSGLLKKLLLMRGVLNENCDGLGI